MQKLREDLWCPSCGHKGMKLRVDRAQSGNKRYVCMGCKSRTTKPSYAPVQVLPETKVKEIKKHNYFVITSAVNNTPLVKKAHETFKAMADHNHGCYLIVPTVYKNPNRFHQGALKGISYPEEIMPYLCNADVKLNKHLTIKGSTRIEQPAVNPLSGADHAGTEVSEIYAHGQVAMQMVATAKNKHPKMLHTTGSVSRPNYDNSPRGRKAANHHSISAIVVEVEGGVFWPRQVHFDGEGCYDLNRYYTPEGAFEGGPVAGIVYGDGHLRALRPRVDRLLTQANRMLMPEKKVFHDLHDQAIGGHHTVGNTIVQLAMSLKGQYSVRDELMVSVRYLEKHPGAYVVDSNHHRHLDQWFNRFNSKHDIVNLPLYFELGELLKADLEAGGDGNLYRLFIHKYCSVPINFVDSDKQFNIAGIDCAQHGDRGANGTKGSLKAFARTGSKTFTGHLHSPGIEKGAYGTGVMSPELEYAKGLSSWLNTHGIVYPNGKRALFSIIDGKLAPSMRGY